MTLGEKIKYYRKNENLSQENLAEKVGVSRQAVTKWESNKSSPSTENLIIISEVLDVSIKDLTSNTPIPRKNKSNKIGIRDKRFYNSFFDEEKIICERKYDFYSLIIGLFIIIPSVVLFHDLTNGSGTGGMTFMELAKLSFAGKGVILLVRNILIFGLMISFVIKSYLSKEEKYKLVNKKKLITKWILIIIPLLASTILFFSPKLFKLLEPTTSLAIALLMMFYYNSFAELLLMKFIKGKEIDLGN